MTQQRMDTDPIYALAYKDPTVAAHFTMWRRGEYQSELDTLRGMVLSLAEEKAVLTRKLVAQRENGLPPIILYNPPLISA